MGSEEKARPPGEQASLFVVDPEGWRSFLFVAADGEEQEANTRRKYMFDVPRLELIYCFQDFI